MIGTLTEEAVRRPGIYDMETLPELIELLYVKRQARVIQLADIIDEAVRFNI